MSTHVIAVELDRRMRDRPRSGAEPCGVVLTLGRLEGEALDLTADEMALQRWRRRKVPIRRLRMATRRPEA